ncbi:MAG: ribonuclease HI family protein [Thermomicrobiales bacterium]
MCRRTSSNRSSRLARSGRKPSSSTSKTFEELSAAIAAGSGWIVSSDHPTGPAPGKQASRRHDVVLIFDGGSRGNPGQGYGSFTYKGVVVRWPTGVEYPGVTTNNEAEYQSMIAGLRAIIFDCHALDLDISNLAIEVRSDSQLVVNQINETWKIKKSHLRELRESACELLDQFARFDVVWHPRSESVRILGH